MARSKVDSTYAACRYFPPPSGFSESESPRRLNVVTVMEWRQACFLFCWEASRLSTHRRHHINCKAVIYTRRYVVHRMNRWKVWRHMSSGGTDGGCTIARQGNYGRTKPGELICL